MAIAHHIEKFNYFAKRRPIWTAVALAATEIQIHEWSSFDRKPELLLDVLRSDV
jgi:hypothetical protein